MNIIEAVKSFYITAPSRLQKEQRSFFTAMLMGFTVASFYHIGLIIYYISIDIPEMVYYHIIGIPLLILGTMFTKIGFPVAGLVLGTIEYCAHSILGTYYIGILSGMYFPIPLASLMWSIIHGGNRSFNRIMAVLTMGVFLGTLYFFFNHIPFYTLPNETLRLTFVMMAATNMGLLICFFAYNTLASGWWRSLQSERVKTDQLLLNILPKKIASRLKEHDEIIADRFDSATVLFLDIVEFTKLSARLPASEVVSILDGLFCQFDDLVDKYGLEKIKTIGDAYMVVAGIPDPVSNHARKIIELAIDMLAVIKLYSNKNNRDIQARIGVCSGPVVAGVIGHKKFIYDLWGDTVNTASRMESHGIPGLIQVNSSIYNILKNDYQFKDRGEIEIKGKGKFHTYTLKPNLDERVLELKENCHNKKH